MELKALADDESSRKRHHMRNKLRKASKKASELIAVLSEMGEGVDARTNLETQVWFFLSSSSVISSAPCGEIYENSRTVEGVL